MLVLYDIWKFPEIRIVGDHNMDSPLTNIDILTSGHLNLSRGRPPWNTHMFGHKGELLTMSPYTTAVM